MKLLNALIEKYFPCSYERGGPILVGLGVLSTLSFVYISIWYRGVFHNLTELVLVVTFFISAWSQRHQLKSDLIFTLLILSIVIPWLLFGINALIDYESADKYKSMKDLSNLFFFLPLAWWMGGSWIAARNILILAFLGLLTAILLDPNLLKSINELWAGKRVDFGIMNAQHTALFFGLVLVFCLIAFSQLEKESASIWILAILLGVCLVGLAGLLGARTRAAYLGMLLCAVVAIAQVIRKGIKFSKEKHSVVIFILLSVFFLGLSAGLAKELQSGRFSSISADIQTIVEGDLEKLPFSVGMRVRTWAESFSWIAERPITGWGPKAKIDVIHLSDRFSDDLKARFGHLHNGYLEMLIGYGIVGLAFLFILIVALLRRIKSTAHQHLYAFAFYGTLLLLVMNMFESLFFYWTGEFAFALMIAGGYSQYLAKSLGGAGQLDSTPVEKTA